MVEELKYAQFLIRAAEGEPEVEEEEEEDDDEEDEEEEEEEEEGWSN